jgi:hypothetical protein
LPKRQNIPVARGGRVGGRGRGVGGVGPVFAGLIISINLFFFFLISLFLIYTFYNLPTLK